MENKIIEGLIYTLPSLVTGVFIYLILSKYIINEQQKKKIDDLINKRKESLPIKLQSYERLLLFCERINPLKLVVRVIPIGNNKTSYLKLLIANIEQEYEHNMVQQLYISNDSWKSILTSKLTIISELRNISETCETAKDLQENILIFYSKNNNITKETIISLKEEVQKII